MLRVDADFESHMFPVFWHARGESELGFGGWLDVFLPRGVLACPVSLDLAIFLDAAFRRWGDRLILSSGYRTCDANRRAGGEIQSGHLFGFAADLVPADGLRKDLIHLAIECKAHGIIGYKRHVHIDFLPRMYLKDERGDFF